MKDFKDIFDNPLHFFSKKRSLRKGVALMFLSTLVFVVLNQAMIIIGLVIFKATTGPLQAIFINYATMLVGYLLLGAVCFLPFRLAGGRSLKGFFTIVSYSAVPIMFLWIPHIIPQAIVLGLSALLMTGGVHAHAKTGIRKSASVTAAFFITAIVLSIAVRNFIVLPGAFNNFP